MYNNHLSIPYNKQTYTKTCSRRGSNPRPWHTLANVHSFSAYKYHALTAELRELSMFSMSIVVPDIYLMIIFCKYNIVLFINIQYCYYISTYTKYSYLIIQHITNTTISSITTTIKHYNHTKLQL